MIFNYDFADPIAQASCGCAYWIDPNSLSRSFCQPLTTKAADLLDVILAIYASDRLSRRVYKGVDTGHRQFHVNVGLRDPDLWSETKLTQKLLEFLQWLGEDDWIIHFAERQTAPYSAELDQFLYRLPPEPPITVSLFSGGLDSLAGLATHMLNNQSSSYILVSGYTNRRLAGRQRLQLRLIRQSTRGRNLKDAMPTVCHVAVPFGLHKLEGQQEDKWQRYRGLVFLAIGAVAALQAGADTLWVFENGIGALNLPLNKTQLGVDNYRGVHPRSLMMAENLFELALDKPLRIRNPFLFRTKTEMCRALGPIGLASAVQFTVSCDSFPVRVPGKSQCGVCTSCILRRQSLLAAGYQDYDPHSGYLYSLLADGSNIASNLLFGSEVMREQVCTLARCLDSDNSWHSLTASFPELFRTHAELVERHELDPDFTRACFVQLFQTYVQEWE
ncbi:MAG: 7-cyano-7-deazaguanine synthase [Caldilineaceae bacterium]|nr:7-cyano-7-deazaguanine synthase [Caldilineaceae bacterium]MDE0338575.1 7-cyano-7-deazaguanine synthase [Caldilineaceae bacterium]